MKKLKYTLVLGFSFIGYFYAYWPGLAALLMSLKLSDETATRIAYPFAVVYWFINWLPERV